MGSDEGEEEDDYSAPPETAVFVVPRELAGMRLDQTLARMFPDYSRSRLQAWLADGHIELEGRCVRSKDKVWGGERVAMRVPAAEIDTDALPEAIALDVVYEDTSLLVLNKPFGLVVHPGAGNRHGTLLNALLHHAPQLAHVPRAGIVHRLDKATSGLLVVGLRLDSQTALTRMIQSRDVKREYLALVHGRVQADGTVDAPIGRHPTQRTRMAIMGNGRPARTHYRVRERFEACTLLHCELDTGRTHQIRVHLTSIGHPLVGDQTYRSGTARAMAEFGRQALHAWRLSLPHPESGTQMRWEAPPPLDFAELMRGLRGVA